jgi:hypothetical protein
MAQENLVALAPQIITLGHDLLVLFLTRPPSFTDKSFCSVAFKVKPLPVCVT